MHAFAGQIHTLLEKEESAMSKGRIQAIRETEQAFWTIVFSARKQIGERGRLLPKRFETIGKIRRFLKRSMSGCLADRLIANLDLRRIKGRLAVPIGDGIGPAPLVKTQVLDQTASRATIAVWFAFDRDDRFFRVYQLQKSAAKGWIVVGRHPLDYPFGPPRRINRADCCARLATYRARRIRAAIFGGKKRSGKEVG
jgi:hypothetical protein